jgi:WD40 repeat protein
MIKTVSFCMLLLFGTDILAQSDKKFLVVEPQGHNALVNDLVYSSLTRELISVSDDKTVRLWDIEEDILSRTIRLKADPSGPIGMLYAAAISPDGRYLAVAGYSQFNDIKIIDLQRNEIVVVLPKHKNIITALAFSPDGKYLASASADESIVIWKSSTNYPYEFAYSLYQHQAKVNDLAFSPDGKSLLSVSDDETCRMWNVANFESEPQIFKGHLGPIKRVAAGKMGFLTGGEKGIVNLWSWNGALTKQIIQFGSPVVDISTSSHGDYAFVSGDKQILINLKSTGYKPLFSDNQNVSASYFTKDLKLILAQGAQGNLLKIDLKTLSPEAVLRGQGLSINKLFIKDQQLGATIDLGVDPSLIFDFQQSKTIRDKSKMKGFTSAVKTDGTFSFQLLGEQQLNFGASFGITNSDRDGRILSYTLLSDGKVIVGSDRTLKVYNGNGELLQVLEGHNGQVLDIVSNDEYVFTNGSDQTIKVWSKSDWTLKYTLFITRDYDWILWSNDGAYTASAGGEQYLNWQVNKNENGLAEHFDVSTYNKQFLTESIKDLNNKRDNTITETIVLPDKPEVRWTSHEVFQTETEEDRVRVKASIYSDQPIEKVRILVSGTPLAGKRSVSDIRSIDEVIELNSYKTTVQLFVSTADAKIVSEKRVFINSNFINSTTSSTVIIDPENKPNLYFVGIGVSKFQNSEFDLTYADDDAVSIHEIFTSGSSPVYNKVSSKLLLNEEATKDNIMAHFRSLAEVVTPKDQVILFIASHGINDEGFYYVLTHEADKNDLTGTCLNWSELAEALSLLPCRVLMFLDTCHSGALGNNLTSNDNYLKNTEALRELGSVEVGVVIMSGSTGDESSLESAEWEHGVFTLSLIKGLKDKEADIRGDGLIFLRELDFFVSNNVYDLTKGKQNPTTQKPSTISKLLIY